MYTKLWWGNISESDHSEDPEGNGRTLLSFMLGK